MSLRASLLPFLPVALGLAACASSPPAAPAPAVVLKDSGGCRLEQVSLAKQDGADRLAARLRSDGPLSAARRTVVITAVAQDGTRLATSTAELEPIVFDHVPSSWARVAVFSAALPRVAIDHYEVELETAPPAAR